MIGNSEGRQLKKKFKKFRVCLFYCPHLLQFQVDKQGICLSILDHKTTMFSLINLTKGDKDRVNSFVTKVLLLLPLNQEDCCTCPVYPALHIFTLFCSASQDFINFHIFMLQHKNFLLSINQEHTWHFTQPVSKLVRTRSH